MRTTRQICQSCGMPLNKDKKGGGTEADGSHSTGYCSYCYSDGHFIQPDLTCEEMEKRIFGVTRKLFTAKHFPFPTLPARLLARRVRKLQRWQNNS